jgi:hypothetical protein
MSLITDWADKNNITIPDAVISAIDDIIDKTGLLSNAIESALGSNTLTGNDKKELQDIYDQAKALVTRSADLSLGIRQAPKPAPATNGSAKPAPVPVTPPVTASAHK